MNSEVLDKAWERRSVLHAEGRKLCVEEEKFYAEVDKLYAEVKKLYTEREKFYPKGRKLYTRGDRLHTEGDLIWLDAVLEVHGNIKLEWLDNGDCKLETGEVFKFKKEVV